MNPKKRMELFEHDSKVLEAIAKQYDEGSIEYLAIKHAAIALFYVLAEDHQKFAEYWTKGDLTLEQRAHLIAMGIDPDVTT